MKIVEVWKPFVLTGSMLMALGLGYWAVRTGDYVFMVFSIIFAWQGGWGVKLDIEVDRLKKEGKL